MWWSGSVSVWLVGLWFASCLHGKVERQTTGEEEEATTEGWWSDFENGTQYAKKSVCEGEDEAAGREEEGKRERRRLHFDWRVLRYFSSCWCKGVLTRGKKKVCVLRVLERRQREESLTECVCVL